MRIDVPLLRFLRDERMQVVALLLRFFYNRR